MEVSFKFIKRYIKMASRLPVLGICPVFSVYERGTFLSKIYTKGVPFLSKWYIKG